MNLAWFDKHKNHLMLALVVVLFLILAFAPSYARTYTVILLSSIIMYVILSLSWSMFSGPTGYTSLATAAFFGVGIYNAALLGDYLPIGLLVLTGGLASFLLAYGVGTITLRLRGVYFAIFTFGLVELIKHVVSWIEVNVIGTRGQFVTRVDNVTVFYVLLGTLAILLITMFLIKRSKYGLALSSIGSSEDAAVHIGINVVRVKVMTFAISALFAGVAGTAMATRWGFIDPYIAFDAFYSFLPTLMAIFGGMGSLLGPILGASIFTYLQEILVTRFPYYYMLIFGTIMVITIIYLPNGIVGLFQKLFAYLIKKLRSGSPGGENADTKS
jgi:branched-chain amino acid transport system permease protein